MKNRTLLMLIILIGVIIDFSCENDNDVFEFGDTQVNFVKDSIYKTSSDGLLFVQLVPLNGMANMVATVYGSEIENPEDTIGIIKTFGSVTIPVKKEIYWKVILGGDLSNLEELKIEWTPIN